MAELPIIDIGYNNIKNDEKRYSLIKKIRHIGERYGCFAITGHGIAIDTLLQLNSVAKEFFALPLEQKLLSQEENSGTGYIPVKGESLGGSDGSMYAGDLKESFNFSSKDSLYIKYPNAPNELLFNVGGYMLSVEERIARLLLVLFAEALYLPSHTFVDKIKTPSIVLRLAYYPATDAKPLPNQFRASPHTDYGTLTMVWASEMKGLQSYDRETGEWFDVPELPADAIYVNIGDIMQIWTNDVWKAALHRVVMPEDSTHDRLSIVFFHNPADDTIIDAVSTCVSDINPRKYDVLTAREHRKMKADNSRKVIEK